MTAAVTIRIQEADFDVGHEIAALTRARTDIGAVVSFSGICRDSENGGAIKGCTSQVSTCDGNDSTTGGEPDCA